MHSCVLLVGGPIVELHSAHSSQSWDPDSVLCIKASFTAPQHLSLSSPTLSYLLLSSQTPWLLLLQELFQWLCNFGTSASLRLISLPLALKSSEPLSPLLLSSPSHRLLKQSPQVSLFFSHTKRRTLGRHCCFLLFWFFLSSFLQKKKKETQKDFMCIDDCHLL